MTRPVLIYDGSRALFRRVADLVGDCVVGVTTVAWGSDVAQQFLEAQFGEQPFAFILVDGEDVHVGDAAVERLLERTGVGAPVSSVVASAYPAAAPAFGRLVHDREPADVHGTFPLDATARTHLDGLRGRSIPVE